MTTQLLASKLISYDSCPKLPMDNKILIQQILKARLKQIDDLKDLCLNNINITDTTVVSTIKNIFEFVTETRTQEIEFVKQLSAEPNMKALHDYAAFLSEQRKQEAAKIMKLTSLI